MSKNIMLSTLAFIAVVGIPICGCDVNHSSENTSHPSENANRLSDGDACQMATSELKTWFVEFNRSYAETTKRPIVLQDAILGSRCANFESISDQGIAQIDVIWSASSHEYNTTNNNLKTTYFFGRTDQGWKIRARKRYNDQGQFIGE